MGSTAGRYITTRWKYDSRRQALSEQHGQAQGDHRLEHDRGDGENDGVSDEVQVTLAGRRKNQC